MANKERMEQIQRILWIMEYKDRWTQEDWAEYYALSAELDKLKLDT